jgi:hypothetical protein
MVKALDVEFIDEDGGGPGVRLRKPPKQKRLEPVTIAVTSSCYRPKN